ncbi:MAG: AAA family ATPase [Emergencia sp.]
MSDKKTKKISIGVEDFKEIIDRNGYFVDKTLMIRDVISSNAKVILFTRPRRFGKTFNQFMIRRFFEDERTPRGEKIDNGYLFNGLAVSRCSEDILSFQQKHPVVFLSLKSAKQSSYKLAYNELKKRISEEFKRHKYVLDSDALSEDEKNCFRQIEAVEDDDSLYLDSIGFLSRCLAAYHGTKTIILIDEYDVPLENAYFQGFYNEMVGFLRSLFESALKTNPYLEKGIITGCLRISKESIFTGLNNLDVDTVIHTRFPDCFGFTENEVIALLRYYKLEDCMDEVKKWYDGYRFGRTEIYNPWSILKYTADHVDNVTKFPLPYWSNTSSNSIIREMVDNADEDTKAELESLMDGGVIEKQIHEDITYEDIYLSQDNLWNFLFFTGYLKNTGQRQENNKVYLELSIPNLEIASIYEDSISMWFEKKIGSFDRSPLIKALEEGDCLTAENFISEQLMDTISYYDYAENYYHGFMTGLLKGSGRYRVTSNRENGLGRPDIILTEKKFMGRAMILELKVADTLREMETKCEQALSQIEERQYAKPLEDDGYNPILKYAVCFFKKGCVVKKAE